MEHSYEAFEEDSASIGTLDKETSAKSPQYKVSNSNKSKSQIAKRKRGPPILIRQGARWEERQTKRDPMSIMSTFTHYLAQVYLGKHR